MLVKLFYLFNIFVILNAVCPSGSVASMKDKNLCFIFNQTKTYFTSAEEACMELGGHLASIHYSIDNMLIAQQAASRFSDSDVSDFWIGATDMLIQNIWTWMDGTPFDYNDWDKGQPQNLSGNDCGSVKIPSGLWISDNCGGTKPFVCTVRTVVATTNIVQTTKATTPSKPLSCLDDWTYNNITKYCYKVMENMNWLDAEDMCKIDGAHLASIHSLDEALWVANFAYYPGANVNDAIKQAWIGLHTDDNNLHWQWTDGTPLDYVKWWSGGAPWNEGMQSSVWIFLAPIFGDTAGTFDNSTYDHVLARSICKKSPS